MPNLLITVPTVITFILERSIFNFFNAFFTINTSLILTGFLLDLDHFFLLLADDAAFAILSFDFLPPFATGYFPYLNYKCLKNRLP